MVVGEVCVDGGFGMWMGVDSCLVCLGYWVGYEVGIHQARCLFISCLRYRVGR